MKYKKVKLHNIAQILARFDINMRNMVNRCGRTLSVDSYRPIEAMFTENNKAY